MRKILSLELAILLLLVPVYATQGMGGKAGIGGKAGFGGGASAGTPTFTVVHNTFCSSNLTGSGAGPYTCTIPSTTAGNLLAVLGVGYQGSTSTLAMTAITDSASESYVHNTPTNQNIVDVAMNNYLTTDSAHILSVGAGVTSVSVTWSLSPGSTSIEVIEISRSSGSWVLDKATGTTDTSCTSCSGAALTSLSGTYDYLLTWGQGANSNSTTPMTISGGSWTSIDSKAADYVTSENLVLFGGWNGSTSANPTNSTITTSPTEVMPVGALAFK